MKNLKQLRISHKLSQQKLAEKLSLSQQTIYKYEHGITEPDIDTLTKIASYFNTSIDYLVGNTDNPLMPGQYFETALNPEEFDHIQLYRHLPRHVQGLIDKLLQEYMRR